MVPVTSHEQLIRVVENAKPIRHHGKILPWLYGLLLELHALTQVACSYALLVTGIVEKLLV